MDYISVEEAAGTWGVSLRQAQRLLAAGRIQGAKKYGRSWMIPAGAQKPGDPRREKGTAQASLADELDRILVAASPPDEGERAYLSGDFGRVLRCYQAAGEGGTAKLCGALLAIAAAVSEGAYSVYEEIERFLKGVIRANVSEGTTAFAQLSLSIAYLGAISPHPYTKTMQL